ncbi:hypothetical protein ACE60T_005464 [Salmonella enterica]
MKQNKSLGYRQLCANALRHEIVRSWTINELRLEVVDVAAVRKRYNEPQTEERAPYAIALYYKSRIVETNFAGDALDSSTSESVQLLGRMVSRVVIRTVINRFVGDGLTPAEIKSFRHDLLELLLLVLPQVSVVDTEIHVNVPWFTQLVILIERMIGPMPSMLYSLAAKNVRVEVSRALDISKKNHIPKMVTCMTVISNDRNDDVRHQKSEMKVRYTQPLDESPSDEVLQEYAGAIRDMMNHPRLAVVNEIYEKLNHHTHGTRDNM